MNIITAGGSEHFNDVLLGEEQIENVLKKNKISKKDLVVYGYSPKSVGSYVVVKTWADKYNIKFINGNPNPQKYGGDFTKALEARNKYLAKESKLLINFTGFDADRNVNTNGGKGFIEEFERNDKVVERVGIILQKDAKKQTPKEPELFVPPADLLKESIKEFSKFAKDLLSKAVTLDTETTGLSEVNDDIIEIAIVEALTGKVLYDSLIYTKTKIGAKAFEKNNIKQESLEGKPNLAEAYKIFAPKIKNKIIIASNSDFDEKMLNGGLLDFEIIPPRNIWMCLQKLYRNYSLQPKYLVKSLNTERIAKQMHIPIGTHRALADAEAQNLILQAMAKGVKPDYTL